MKLETLDNEIWKEIKGYENLYLISNMGRVMSLRNSKERILKPILMPQGYLKINLYLNGKSKPYFVHRLVAYAFPEICGEWFDKCEIDHIDTNPQNNIAENLRVVNSKENHNNPLTKEHYRSIKIGKPTWGLGKNYSKEHCANISKALKGKYALEKNPNAKPINQFDTNGNFIRTWNTVTEAANEIGCGQPAISMCLTNRRKFAGGYMWKYAR